ncbi:hypothetical protein [Halomonas sp. NCCP-2165]|nr:hypothetical protein [Halomonas sp. NCCP-2165]GKW49845.1 hypothetical protein NCCP2165_20600 [Halomonas sp. NCCP-2165]
MNVSKIAMALVVTGLAVGESALAQSTMEQRFREEGRQLDLTGFFNAESDARSRTFNFGSEQEHAFEVTEAGTYELRSELAGGYAPDYRLRLALLDSEGAALARFEGRGEDLALRQTLGPGEYRLRVEGQKFGARGQGARGFYLTVNGLEGVSVAAGDGGILFSRGEESDQAFVRNSERSVRLGAGASAGASAEAAGAGSQAVETASAGAEAQPAERQAAAEPVEPEVRELVTDVRIRARSEVMRFEMAEEGRVAIATSTYPPGYESTYRIELEVVDGQGNVVAEGAGQGFDGNVTIEPRLPAGQYRIRVQGQKFGTGMSGVNNYELRVRLLD